MAELTQADIRRSNEQPIPASTQMLAVAWLRWRMFVNSSFRRRPRTSRQAVGFAFSILLRLIVWPVVAAMMIGPVVGSGLWAWGATAHHHPERLQNLMASVVLGWQFVAINGLSIAAAVSNFDPASLIRYPLRFGRYFVLRTLVGLMTPSTIVGCLALLAAVVGIGIANPLLALPALIVLAVYALMNIFLTRLLGAWMERWLANRRFREIFSVLIALFAVSLQLLSFQRYTPHARSISNNWLLRFLESSGSYLHWLPPGFASSAILHGSHPLSAAAPFACLLAWTVLFAAVFAIRLRKQFHGEYLGEGVVHRRAAKSVVRAKAAIAPPGPRAVPVDVKSARPIFPPVIAACLRKEWLTFRGNSAGLIGMFTPLVFVVILNRGQFAAHPSLFLPGAIAYVLIGVLAGLYNVFGAEGLGVQVYLLAPIRMRDVILAKNISSLSLIVTQAVLAWTVVALLKRTPIPLSMEVSTACWTVFVIAMNVTLGTMRSIQSPRRFVPGQMRQRRGTPTNRTNSLLVLLVLFGSLLLQLPVVLVSRHFREPWLGAWIFGPLALAAVCAYALLLRNAERLVLAHRDILTEELCKA